MTVAASRPEAVLGIGLDLVAVARMGNAAERHGPRLAARLLAPAEERELAALRLAGSRLAEYLAGRFAAKEAVAKATGLGIAPLGWRNIEITGAGGAPACRLSGHAREIARARGIGRLLVTITHEQNFAAACAIALGVPAGHRPEEAG